MKCYPDNFEAKIGFDAVRGMVAERCLSSLGKIKTADMAFSSDFSTVDSRLRAVSEMMTILADDAADLPLSGIHDLTSVLAAIRPAGTHVPEQDLARLRSSLSTIADIEAFFRKCRSEEGTSPYPALDAIASRIALGPEPLRAVSRIIDISGAIRDDASPELSQIRRELSQMSGTINAAMRRVIAHAVASGVVEADVAPSVRDGRLVIPVAPANKRKIQGIVHDESASGKTFFIEPAEVVEANNRLRELQIEERREILRILTVLADILRPHLPALLEGFDVLADFDFIQAKARLGSDLGANLPQLSPEPALDWVHACHPVLKLALERQGKQIVPLDIELTSEKRLLVISGPNAGGKSVTLKTVAIVQYMAQCGILPPLQDNSRMGIFDSIFIDIGDDQSIVDDLSTYSSHLRSMKHFLQCADPRTLILIDEFGGGTEPTIGGAIAQALLVRFCQMGMWGVVTTHFQNLKRLASETPGLVNGSMLYDRSAMRPLFRLSIGTAGSSFALEIARKTGLPTDIVDEASKIVGSDYVNLDKYLLDIARDRRYWENKRLAIRQKEKRIEEILEKYADEADTLHRQRREIIDDARTQAQRILDESNAAIERTIHEIRRSQADKERTIKARKQLSESRSQLQEAPADSHPLLQKASRKKKKATTAPAPKPEPKELHVGDVVVLEDGNTPGRILEISGEQATVAFGMLKTNVKLSRLRPTLKKISASNKSSIVTAATTEASRERQLQFRPEIDVRGMRADEALQAVTYFIDDAVQFNAGRVRILHGTGTGALRQALRQYLQTVPSVITARDEDVRFGGAGITVVELR